MLGACHHEHLLPLLGFSADTAARDGGAGVCLVTPLSQGGSVEDRLRLDEHARLRLAMMPGAPENGCVPAPFCASAHLRRVCPCVCPCVSLCVSVYVSLCVYVSI